MNIEILAPAHDPDSALTLARAGADALYPGLRGFCRWAEKGLNLKEIESLTHKIRANFPGVKIYPALNRIPALKQMPEFFRILAQLQSLKLDGVILNDAGIIKAAKKIHPDLKIISSVGLAPTNRAEAGFLVKLGVSRLLLPEDTAIDELKTLKAGFPGLELEMFYAGKKDFTYTGKCFISSYAGQEFRKGLPFSGSAKRGGCSQICRESWNLNGINFPLAPREFCLQEHLPEFAPYLTALKLGHAPLNAIIATIENLKSRRL